MASHLDEEKERERFLDDGSSPNPSDRWGSPAPAYASTFGAPTEGPTRKRKILRYAGITFLVFLFFCAFAADPKPVYNKATELFADDDPADAELLASNELATEFSSDTVVEGGSWAHELHNSVDPVCDHNATRQLYPNPGPRTALATFPRSGNTFIRTMVERATGYLTSSDYCDHVLAETFKAECDHQTNFFVKTHYPALKGRSSDNAHLKFDRAVSVVRNPIDCLFSYWQFTQAWKHRHDKVGNAADIHTARVNVTLGETDEQVAEVKLLTARWIEFNQLWHQVPIPVQLIRYEDLRLQPLSLLMNLVQFLLPSEELPSMERLSCALELDEKHEAYHSKKRSIFSSWDDWEPSLRKWVVHKSKTVWCRNGYDRLLLQEMGQEAVDELELDCAQVKVDEIAAYDTSMYYEDDQ